MKQRRASLFLITSALAPVGVAVVVILGWTAGEGFIDRTSGQAFCSSCHSMETFANTYQRDVHGGRNGAGVKAVCVDCHLPHDGVLRYLLVKARTGLRDIWAEVTRDPNAIDWQALRNDRAAFVYDSGCLSCHRELEQATEHNPGALLAHRAYFRGETERHCVACHPRVGHSNLREALAGQGG
jgi:cytochrome c-type protein NapC